MSTLSIVVIVIVLLVILAAVFFSYKKYQKYKLSVGYAWLNDFHCGEDYCDPPIVDLPLPVQEGTTYSVDVARYCADLVCRLGMGKVDNKLNTPNGLFVVRELFNTGSGPIFGIIWKSEGVLWIVFRGTRNNHEWMQDFTYSQNIMPKKREERLEQARMHFAGVSNSPMIHEGFTKVYNAFRSDLLDTLESEKPTQVIVTGHSLGAAVSTIAGVDLANSGYNTIVYNFASPRVGDGELCSLIAKLKLPIYRHVNISDMVPTTPLAVNPSFSNPPEPYMYSHCGIPLYFDLNWKSMGNNHLMTVYIEAFTEKLYKQ